MPKPRPPEPSDALKKFRSSMIMDLEKWREGIGYDMDAFAAMTDDEKQAVIAEIREKKPLDWRDMEVLKFDNSKDSFDRLRDVLATGSCEERAHALGDLYEMGRMNDSVFDHKLADILNDLTDGDGMTAALLLLQTHCGPKTRAALEKGVRERPDIALHFAAELLDLEGLSDDMAAFDPKFRPTLLKLLPDEPEEERKKAIEQVFAWLGSKKKAKK
jgi:hypothetical protein